MDYFDDSDMKIVGSNILEPTEKADIQNQRTGIELLKLEEQVNNGNMDKAKATGVYFAKYIVDYLTNEVNDKKYAMEVLVLFSFVLNIDIQTTFNSLVAYTMINQFYDYLKLSSESMYRNLQFSISYSLYLLSSRGKTSTSEYAKIFANACGYADSHEYIALGEGLFERFEWVIKKKISSLNLK